MVFNIFLTPGEGAMAVLGSCKITKEGLMLARKNGDPTGLSGDRFFLMTLTTTPNQLTDGLERRLRPLNKIHVPVHEIAMMMSIALRFIPILMEETDKIMKAQIARGADFENGNLIQKAKTWFHFWFRCLFLRSAEPMTWPWRWKQDVIMVEITDPDETAAL